LPRALAPGLVIGLLLASAAMSVNDYFRVYTRQPQTAYWLETAARDLADDINDQAPGTAIHVDRRFWEGWPAVPFLVGQERALTLYRVGELAPDQIRPPAVVYAWPYERLDETARSLAAPALVSALTGSLAQGDLEPEPYPLYIRYQSRDTATLTKAPDESSLANFDNSIQLRGAEISPIADGRLQADLYWSLVSGEVDRQLVAYVHVIGPDGLIGQSDSVPAGGNWPVQWWRRGLIIADSRLLDLDVPYEEGRDHILIGLYDATTQEHLPVLDQDGVPASEAWLWQP